MEPITIILFALVFLFLLYIVIETAVRRGINSSVLGEPYRSENKKKTFLDDDLDKD
ncbi:hypothetical protein LS684_10905 [Cytobacillus spongiae]|uniref:hypothetical protein n=1 Tax=Cytobacillus spongiae TaxID=2901381 RepID=UPI001F37AAA2|nr:hypothetical protein [Cytobacillus spongiae]UII54206.1 hypothetical protein LS684_10905 [Cytobacillus spongiae]